MDRAENSIKAVLVAAFVLAVLVPALAGADTVRRSFDVVGDGTLAIDTDLGGIDVRAGAAGRVLVTVEREARSGDDEDFELSFDQSGDDVRVTGTRPGGSWGWNSGNRFRVHFEVEVPAGFSVDLSTSGGSISVASLSGDVACATSGGDVALDDVGGRVDCRTSGGDIEIGKVAGTVLAKTSGGDIRIDRSGGSVVAKTSGGDIVVDEVLGSIEASTSGGSVRATIASQPLADCRLTTSGGRVELTIDPSVAANLDAKTSGGSVHVDFPVTVQGEIGRSSLQAVMNGGGPQIYLRTSGGGIHLKSLN
ncbi:MAG: DUF4097 domain-containing protein [Acidobacteriota bacterium]|nr:DUF4097 domain-containing protein [Acidobacteriota bacterium]